MLKQILLITVTTALSACAFEKDKSNLYDANEQEQRQLLINSYDQIKGTYAGTVSTSNGYQDVALEIYWKDEPQSQPNANGAVVMVPKLKATLKKIAPVGLTQQYNGVYIPSSGEVILTNIKLESQLKADEIQSLNTRMTGQRLSGEAKSSTGFLGVFDVVRTTSEASTPDVNDDIRYADGLRKQLQEVAGVYEGVITPTSSTAKPFKATMTLNVQSETVAGRTVPIPVLLGNFARSDDNSRVTDLTLRASYNLDVTPRRLELEGLPVFNSSKYRATFMGVLVNDEYVGEMQAGPIIFNGTFVFKKKK